MFQAVGEYVIDKELARGGAGVVFLAHDASGRPVALKLLLAGQHSSETMLKRFHREAQILARLNHPHVVRVRESGSDHGLPFLAMDLVQGANLQEVLDAEGPFEPRRAAELIRQVASAVAHAHELGLLHRDLKPSNVLLDDDGQAHLTDFGLVKELVPSEGQTRLSLTGQLLGTPGYWAPEQAHGQLDRIGPASDVYGLGATLYALLAGRPPHVGESLVDLLGQMDQPPEPVRRHRPQVPPALEAICQRCLQAEPSRRYPTASALESALATWLAGEPAEAPPGRGAPAIAASLALLGLFFAAALVWTRGAPTLAVSPAPAGSSPATTPSPGQSSAGQPAADRPDLNALAAQSLVRFERFESWEACLEPLEQALTHDPQHVAALATRARIYALQQHPRAEAELARVEALAPDHPQLLLAQADVTSLSGGPEAVLDVLQRALTVDPDCVPALCRIVDVLLELGLPRDALSAAERAVSLAPERAWPWIVRARAQTDPEAVSRDLTRAAELFPTHPRLYLAYANGLVAQGRLDRALIPSLRAVGLAPHRVETQLGLAHLFARLDRFKPAADTFRRALELREDPDTLCSLSRALAATGDVEAALEACERALELAPTHAKGLVGKAVLLESANRFDEAEQIAELLFEHHPGHPAAWRIRGRCRALRGERVNALADLQRARELALASRDYPLEFAAAAYRLREVRQSILLTSYADAEAVFFQGISLVDQRRLGQALRFFERALELDPDLPQARAARAFCRVKLGEGSHRELTRALEQNPNSLWIALMSTLLSLESAPTVPERLGLVEDLVSRFPGAGPALRLRSVLRFENGDRRGAMHDLDAAIADRDDPTRALSMYAQGAVFATRRPAQAERILRTAIELDPLHALALGSLATVLQGRGHPAEALRYLLLAVELQPDL